MISGPTVCCAYMHSSAFDGDLQSTTCTETFHCLQSFPAADIGNHGAAVHVNTMPQYKIDEARLRECAGLPLPLANGNIYSANVGRIISIWPPHPCPYPSNIIAARFHSGLIHPVFNAAIHARFADSPALRGALPVLRALGLTPLTLKRLAPCVAQLSPHVHLQAMPTNAVHALLPLNVIDATTLHKLWELLLSVHAFEQVLYPQTGQHEAALWSPLHRMRILPAQRMHSGQVLLPLEWSGSIIVPPSLYPLHGSTASLQSEAQSTATDALGSGSVSGTAAPASYTTVDESDPVIEQSQSLDPVWCGVIAATQAAGVPVLHPDYHYLARVCWPLSLPLDTILRNEEALDGVAVPRTNQSTPAGLLTAEALLHKLRLAYEYGLADFSNLSSVNAWSLLRFLSLGCVDWPVLGAGGSADSQGMQANLEFLGNLPLFLSHSGA